MVNPRRFILWLTLFVATLAARALAPDYDTSTRIAADGFHTLQWKVNCQEFTPPIIYLDSDDRLEVSFDELADDRRYMRYELIHCNALWQPDNLIPSEYIEGFNEQTIDDYAFSEATLIHYVNYRLTIPNGDMRPLVSGNYLLRIYDETDPEQTLLQMRFCVVEPTMKINASVTSRTDIDYNDAHQQLSVVIDPESAMVNNPFTDLILTVEQNGRQDNMVTISGPTAAEGRRLLFDHDRRLIFPAGNEYRRMEVVSTSYPGMGVESLSFSDPYYHATLHVDDPRVNRPYSYDQTQFGGFKIREYNSLNSDIEAEYVIVHFALNAPRSDIFDIFIDGNLTQRRFEPQSRMIYNAATRRYENTMLLKQGAYNYQYLAVPVGSMTGETAPIEGDLYQTANQYLLKLYHRRPGERYDRLTAVGMVTSGT